MNRAQRRAYEKFMRDDAVTSRRFKQGECLNCTAPLSGITGPPGEPERNSAIMVCAYCSHIMEWDGETLVELSDEAIAAVAGDPDVLAVLQITADFRAAQPPDICAACGHVQAFGKRKCGQCDAPLKLLGWNRK
jgi:hypothetical protein